MKIKICGLFREADIHYANEVKPDYIGFVFAGSKRQITREKARYFRSLLRKEILAVGVFADERAEVISSFLEEGIIDIAQLHGDEGEETILAVRKKTGRPVWKAIKPMKEPVEPWLSSKADLLLFDSGKGCGRPFDWGLLKQVNRPFALAGGIGLDNMEKAVREVRPAVLDVSSKAEKDGYKDLETMRELVRRVRNE